MSHFAEQADANQALFIWNREWLILIVIAVCLANNRMGKLRVDFKNEAKTKEKANATQEGRR